MYDATIVRENPEKSRVLAGFANQSLNTSKNTFIASHKSMAREGASMRMPSCMSY